MKRTIVSGSPFDKNESAHRSLHIARLFSSLISSSLALEAAQRGRAMRTEETAPVPTYTPSDPTVASEETLKPDLIPHTS